MPPYIFIVFVFSITYNLDTHICAFFIVYDKNTDSNIILNDVHGIELNNTDHLTYEHLISKQLTK